MNFIYGTIRVPSGNFSYYDSCSVCIEHLENHRKENYLRDELIPSLTAVRIHNRRKSLKDKDRGCLIVSRKLGNGKLIVLNKWGRNSIISLGK